MVSDFCVFWDWFIGVCCDCIRDEEEKLLLLRSFSVDNALLAT